MKVCTPEQMQSIDRTASEKFNIPSIVLMENAASVCVEKISHFDSYVVICGKGNNGGDGLAIARRLVIMGKKVKIYLALGENFSGDALVNYNILKSMGVKMLSDFSTFACDIKCADCVVDAIFGTGFSGEVKPPVSDIIECINKNSKFTLCVDVPSGIDSETGEVSTLAVKASKTVTFAAYKKGMLLFPAADFTGEVEVGDISIPREALSNIKINTTDEEYAASLMPKRHANSHKGDYGKILVIGGQSGMKGAVALACLSALRMGAGLVTACVPEEIANLYENMPEEVMTKAFDFEKDADKIADMVNDYDAVLFGNGIGRSGYVLPLLEKVLEKIKIPIVVDADGLFALSQKPEIIFGKNAVLTPHSMEMARLLGTRIECVEKGRFSVSYDFAKKYNVTLVLKGNHSIISAPDGRQNVNMTGNSGMATAGSGDVLAGMVAALLTKKASFDAATLAVHLHGRAGDYAKAQLSEASVIASDIINSLPHILPVENQ